MQHAPEGVPPFRDGRDGAAMGEERAALVVPRQESSMFFSDASHEGAHGKQGAGEQDSSYFVPIVPAMPKMLESVEHSLRRVISG